MERRARVISSAVFAGLVTIVVGASLTWACTGPTFGTPATPANPPPPSPDASSGPASTTQIPGGAPASGPAAVEASPATGASGSGVTSGARESLRATGRAPADNGAPTRAGTGVSPRGVTAPSNGVADSQFAQRASGATAGVTSRGGQTVFASPAAKAPKASNSRAAEASRATPSARSASGDLWSGFKPAARSSVFAAESAAGDQGSAAPMTAALVVLGLGLVGLVGTASVLGARRRRAAAKATGGSSSGTTEM